MTKKSLSILVMSLQKNMLYGKSRAIGEAESASASPILEGIKRRLKNSLYTTTTSKGRSEEPNILVEEHINKLFGAYDSIHAIISQLDERMIKSIHNYKDSLLKKYQKRITEFYRKIESLNEEMNGEKLKIQENELVRRLQQKNRRNEEELKKISDRNIKLEKDYKKIQEEYEEALKDKRLLYQQLITVKKENKIMFKKMQKLQTGPNLVPNLDNDSLIPHQTTQDHTQILRSYTEEELPHLSQTMDPVQLRGSNNTGFLMEDTIRQLQRQLALERTRTQACKAQSVRQNSTNAELKEFFLSCIEEVKKDISARQYNPLSSPSSIFSKKTTSVGKIPLSSFLQTDKRRVMEMILSSEEFTDELLKHFFPLPEFANATHGVRELMAKAKEARKKGSISLRKIINPQSNMRKTHYLQYKPLNF